MPPPKQRRALRTHAYARLHTNSCRSTCAGARAHTSTAERQLRLLHAGKSTIRFWAAATKAPSL
eukprot:3169575-Pleurochrysis_carterae.AAC.3